MLEFANFAVCLCLPVLFIAPIMSTTIFNIGKVNTINHNDITINTNADHAADVLRTVMAEEVTDETVRDREYCPYIQPDKLKEVGVYTIEQFDQLVSREAEQPAPVFAKFLHKHEKSGYLRFEDQSKRQVFDTLHAYYPSMKDYSYGNFALYF